MSTLKVTSKFKIANRIFYVLGILFFCFLSILFFSKYKENHFNTANLIPVVLFALFAIFVFYYIISLPVIYVFSDKIELKSHFGLYKKTYFLSEIENWLVRQKESKYGNYEELYLTLNSTKIIKLKSYDYDDFYEVRSVITRNKPQSKILKDQLEKKESLRLAIICTLLGLLFIYIAGQFYKDASLTKNDVSIIKARLSDDIKLERHKSSKSLIFKLENFNEFKFKIGSLAIKETYYTDLMNDVKKGNVINLTIEKDQYQKKISKKTPMSILDKYFHYEKIDVVAAESKDFKYLSLSDYNKVNRQNDYWGIGFFGLFGVCLLIRVFI